jgi:putative phosphonate metabolism protein
MQTCEWVDVLIQEATMNFQRYAIYFTPPLGPLSDFGAAWLGWDVNGGTEVAHPELPELASSISEITKTPRKYGFHATMKPPFRLDEEYSFEDLRASAAEICASLAPVKLDGLKLDQIGRFLALTPVGNEAALNGLAGDVVRAFDRFRAPASEAELQRRRAAGLSAAQEENLTTWGYPYVMEECHFHMTLSGKLSKSQISETHARLSDVIDPLLPKPFEIRDLSLVGEAEDGRFHFIERFALSGA